MKNLMYVLCGVAIATFCFALFGAMITHAPSWGLLAWICIISPIIAVAAGVIGITLEEREEAREQWMKEYAADCAAEIWIDDSLQGV